MDIGEIPGTGEIGLDSIVIMIHDHDLLSILTHYLCRQTFLGDFPLK